MDYKNSCLSHVFWHNLLLMCQPILQIARNEEKKQCIKKKKSKKILNTLSEHMSHVLQIYNKKEGKQKRVEWNIRYRTLTLAIYITNAFINRNFPTTPIILENLLRSMIPNNISRRFQCSSYNTPQNYSTASFYVAIHLTNQLCSRYCKL